MYQNDDFFIKNDELCRFDELDDSMIEEFNWDEFTYLTKIANVELELGELEEAWAIMDPEDSDAVVRN